MAPHMAGSRDTYVQTRGRIMHVVYQIDHTLHVMYGQAATTGQGVSVMSHMWQDILAGLWTPSGSM